MIPKIHGFVRHLVEDELSYNLSRKYPVGKWFKFKVFLMSVLVFVFLTVFNLATNGFDRQLRYTTDPNTTESERHWYNHEFFTWGDDNLDPKCQNTDIPVGHEFMTTNLGLRYTVQRILYFPPGSQIGQQRSSVSYHDNTLTNCEVNVISVYLRKADLSKPNKDHRWWSWMDSSADAVARCDIINNEGFFTLEFLVKYATLAENYNYVAVNNATANASFWWGARLLNAYFVGTQYVMSGWLPDSNKDTPIYTRATLAYSAGNTTSMKDPRLFNNWYYFLDSEGDIDNEILDVGVIYNNLSYSKSRPLTEGFFFAKVFRSLILADLGNSQAPNLLHDPDLLQYALNPVDDDFNRMPGAPLSYDKNKRDWWRFTAIPAPDKPLENGTVVPMDQAFAKFKGQTGNLKINTTSIYAEYSCSVPEKKATLAMVLFTLVANLALFQTAWALFKYVLDRKVTWKDPTKNYCEGCDAYGHRLMTMGDGDISSVNLQETESFHGVGSSSTRKLLQDENLEDWNDRC